MVRTPNPEIREEDLHGFKHFKLLLPVLDRLHHDACARDRAGNRKLHYDPYTALLLLYFFNPIVTSLRGIQQASKLAKVQRRLGCPRASLGSLSEAARVFDAARLRELIEELANELPNLPGHPEFKDLRGVVTLVDGTVLSALPKLVQAMWGDANERAALQEHLLLDRAYVLDRRYAKFALFAEILQVKSSFVCRVRDNSVFEVLEERICSPEARPGAIRRDAIVRFTGDRPGQTGMDRPLRLVEIVSKPRHKAHKHARGGPDQGEVLLVATDILEVEADVIALLYKHRWAIETFFRFFKHVLGCRHLLSHYQNGIEIQTYVAIIVCLLIALWTGRKPTLRTYEMLCFHMTGLASEEELLAHIEKLQPQS